jgi:radical SAM superfamily enzyme YgiQ (UPF0313 family)
MGTMRIFLADLGHNQLTKSSDVYPLGIANLTTYIKAYIRGKEDVSIQIFREPQDIISALDKSHPDILGLSSYPWNHELSLSIARYQKSKPQRTIILMGGPNFPLSTLQQEFFLRSMPEIDIAVRGPIYEGERAFFNIIQRLLDVSLSLEGLFEEPVPGNMWINPRTGDFIRGPGVERIDDLDEIPSPYKNGVLDNFFSTGYFPMMQIARGCPFSCTYCNSSVGENNRVYAHSVENVKNDLLYIASRVRPELPLCLADDNFGMYQRDEEIADYIRYLQDRFNWPRYIRTTTGKNNIERIIRVMNKTRGGLPMTAAVQSLNPVVLKNIERSNIRLDTYKKIQNKFDSRDMQSYGELILCLPGETKASFEKAIEDLIESGVKRISAHQLMLLNGTPLNENENKKRFGFNTKFRVVARNIGNYTGEPVVEIEEVVVSTNTFSFEEYLETRIFHLLLTIFFYEGNFEEAFEFSRLEGIKPFKLIQTLQSMLEKSPSSFNKLIKDFITESKEELFETKAECLEWAHKNFQDLVDGNVGGNLLSKYSMLGRFHIMYDSINFLESCIASLLEGSKRTLIKAVTDYLKIIMLHVPFERTLEENPHLTTAYNIEGWRTDGYVKSLEAYCFSDARTFSTFIEDNRKSMIKHKVKTFGEHPAGLGKFTRTMFSHDLRRNLISDKN